MEERTIHMGKLWNFEAFSERPALIGDTGAVTVDGSALTGDTITVPDPKIILPNTGGNGTMIFTICGASLIALAGALFLIYRKKSSAK